MSRKLIMLTVAVLVTFAACKKEATNPDELVQARVTIGSGAGGNMVTNITLTGTDALNESNYKNPKVWMLNGKVVDYQYKVESSTSVTLTVTTTGYQLAYDPELFHRWVLANGKVDTLKISNTPTNGAVVYDLH
ncbi:MAG: hypothetical protein V4456_12590 [Bacteroidota bacterium]